MVHIRCCKQKKEQAAAAAANNHRSTTSSSSTSGQGVTSHAMFTNGPTSSTVTVDGNGVNNALAVAAAAAAQLNLNLNYHHHQQAAAAVAAAAANACNNNQLSSSNSTNNNANNSLTISDLANMGTNSNSTSSESCLFCNKPLANLNDFNKKMHLENCKIRKSIEGNISSKSKKDDSASLKSGSNNSNHHNHHQQQQQHHAADNNIDLGMQCMYCSRSFTNLSNFNKRLHFEHCKVKKRKLRQAMGGCSDQSSVYGQTNANLLVGLSPSTAANTPLNLSLLASHNSHHHPQQHQQHHLASNQVNGGGGGIIFKPTTTNACTGFVNNSSNIFTGGQATAIASTSNGGDLGDSCLFCSRSLLNLSNFNKRVHIETCKVKQLKKETANRLKQFNKTIKKKPTPVVKKEKPSMNSLYVF